MLQQRIRALNGVQAGAITSLVAKVILSLEVALYFFATTTDSNIAIHNDSSNSIKPQPFILVYFVAPILTLLLVSIVCEYRADNLPHCNLVLAYASLQVSNYVLLVLLLLANEIYKFSSISKFIATSGNSVGYFISHSITINNVLKGLMAMRLSLENNPVWTFILVGILMIQLVIYFPLSEAMSSAEGYPTELIYVNTAANVTNKYHIVLYSNINPLVMTNIHYVLVTFGFALIGVAILVREYNPNDPHYKWIGLGILVSFIFGVLFNVYPDKGLKTFVFECIAIGVLYIILDLVLIMRTLKFNVTRIFAWHEDGFFTRVLFKPPKWKDVRDIVLVRIGVLSIFVLVVGFVLPHFIKEQDAQFIPYQEWVKLNTE